MPEMPEVETIRRGLAACVKGRKISEAEVLLPRLIKYPSSDEFAADLKDRTITDVRRRGKYLLFPLDSGSNLVIHLRMTGQLIYRPNGTQDDEPTHIRLVFHLDGGDSLIFADMRTFGAIYLIKPDEENKINGLYTLGPEPLSKEFTASFLKDCLKGRKGKIKPLLLDQTAIAGLGNIYADEALFLAKIHPLRVAAELADNEIKKLHKAINEVIEAGLKDGGTTFSDYRDAHGDKGSHQDNLNVYHRTGQPCKNCQTPIERMNIAGRSAHFCPKCQKL